MRVRHYPVLIAVCAALFLPSLGAHALWDMDEGVNAGCAKEMFEAGTWVVPIFNGDLRSAKPALLYWLQILSFSVGGISEWTARLPSVVCGIGTVLVTYELARRMFDATTGLLAGVALASTIQFNLLAHAATPDAPLILFVTLTLTLAWRLHETGDQRWLVWPAIPCGLALLTKGPIGLAGPGLALLIYYAWNRELRRFLDRTLLYGLGLLTVVVAPWVALVAAETRGEWITRFLLNENANRIATAQENHSGPVIYYLVCVLLLFAPWSSVIGGTAWFAVKAARGRLMGDNPRPLRFLIAWVLAFFVPFSLIATKLPNYIAPIYPALAVLTAWLLVRWARGGIHLPRWVLAAMGVAVFATGAAFTIGFLLVGGATPFPPPGDRLVPGLAEWAWIGAIPMAASAVMAWSIKRERRWTTVVALAAAAVALVGVVAAGPVLVIDAQKSQKTLALGSGAADTSRDIRLAAARYFQDSESIVFYCGRRVEKLQNAEQVREFLALPNRFLFIPEPVWKDDFARTPNVRIAARKYDLQRDTVVLVIATPAE